MEMVEKVKTDKAADRALGELVERLRSYAESLDALRAGVTLDESQRLANVTPALSAKAMNEAADMLEALAVRGGEES